MMLRSCLVFSCLFAFNYAIYYDRFTAEKLSTSLRRKYTANNTLANCAVDIKKCNAKDYRTIDGSCNNLKNPVRGTNIFPKRRVLPAAFYNGRYPRKTASGKDLRLTREVRTRLLCEGEAIHTELNQAAPGFGIFIFGDIGSDHDIESYIVNKTDCCGAGKDHYFCTPNLIPEDDPLHRHTGIKCLNMSRPLDFQYWGCTDDPTPSPIEESTPVYDLDSVYNALHTDGATFRTFEGGLLITEDENGINWPKSGDNMCLANSPGQRCFGELSNNLLPVQLFMLWFMRQHNYFAKELAKLNPCWDDHKLFHVARDINIAFSQQVHVYEWMGTLIGKQNLVNSGVIGKGDGFRDLYNENMYPTVTVEFVLSLRWFHTIQNGQAKMYDSEGNYLRDYPLVNSTFRTGFLAEANNLREITRGFTLSEAHAAHHGVEPDMANRGLPNIQDFVDTPASDLHKERLFGLRPYIDYVEHFFGLKITCFEDLHQLMSKERVLLLKAVYEDVKDIELLPGLWYENLIEGGHIPATLAAIINDNILHNIKGDRHWYERKKRPHAFTHEQLKEIRKSSLATLMCSVADNISVIQKHAFLNVSPKNPLVSCDEIPKIDLTKWLDDTCSEDYLVAY